jgi:hypothetical protein
VSTRDAWSGGRPGDLSYGLPFVDEHHVVVAAGAAAVWQTLTGVVGRKRVGRSEAYARLVGAEPAAASGSALEEGSTLPGMRVVESVPGCRAVLAGRHFFFRYTLVLELESAPDGSGTVLRAATYAVFPGPLGFVYRQLVIGSGAHGKLVRRLLAEVRDRVGAGAGARGSRGADRLHDLDAEPEPGAPVPGLAHRSQRPGTCGGGDARPGAALRRDRARGVL